VIPLRDVSLSVRLVQAPAAVYLAPSREPLVFEFTEDRVRVKIPEVRGHAMVVFEEAGKKS
jgi:hypothetical protein